MGQLIQSTRQRLFELAIFGITGWLASWWLLWTTLGPLHSGRPIDTMTAWGGLAICGIIYFIALYVIVISFRWILWLLFLAMAIMFVVQTIPALSAALHGQKFAQIPYDPTQQLPATTILLGQGILAALFLFLVFGFSITGEALERSINKAISVGIGFCIIAWIVSLVMYLISPQLLFSHLRTALQVIFLLCVASLFIPKRSSEHAHGLPVKPAKAGRLSFNFGGSSNKDALRLGKKVLISQESRKTHMYVVGKTGSGKSKAMQYWFMQDIEAGRGCALVDPHGDLVDDVLATLAQKFINSGVSLQDVTKQPITKRLVLIDPTDEEYAVGLNPLQTTDQFDKEDVALLLEDAVRKLWGFEMHEAPLIGDLINNAAYILSHNNLTLMELDELLTEDKFRKSLVETLTDRKRKHFWEKEYKSINPEYVGAVKRRFRHFTTNKYIKPVIGKLKSTIDLRKEMDDNSVILCKIPKNLESGGHFLGAYIVSLFQKVAMSRGNEWKGERRSFYLYIDEFQNFITDTFSIILSEGRKYGLHAVLAHQYINQIDKRDQQIKDAVFGNVKTKIAFQVSHEDAEVLAEEFYPITGLEVKGTNYDVRTVKIGQTSIPVPITSHMYKTGLEERNDQINEFFHLQPRQFIVKQDGWEAAEKDSTVDMPDVPPGSQKIQQYVTAIKEASYRNKNRGNKKSEILDEINKRSDYVYKLIEDQQEHKRSYQ